MYGGKLAARAKGGDAVVRTGGFGFGVDLDGGLGGGSDGGGVGNGWYIYCNRLIVK